MTEYEDGSLLPEDLIKDEIYIMTLSEENISNSTLTLLFKFDKYEESEESEVISEKCSIFRLDKREILSTTEDQDTSTKDNQIYEWETIMISNVNSYIKNLFLEEQERFTTTETTPSVFGKSIFNALFDKYEKTRNTDCTHTILKNYKYD